METRLIRPEEGLRLLFYFLWGNIHFTDDPSSTRHKLTEIQSDARDSFSFSDAQRTHIIDPFVSTNS